MADGFTVTPWEVEGSIDYNKLITMFGLEPIDVEKLPDLFKDNLLFRRGIIFAHRDLGRVINAVKDKKPFTMMTGLMPSGNFHFGHKLIADQIIFYQSLGAKVYLAVADIEAFSTRIPNMKELRKIATEQYLANYIALGLDIKRCDFYFQSHRSTNGKKACAYYSLANMLSRHATFNEMKAMYGDISPAKMSSSLLQAADMLHPQLPEFEGKPMPTLIPIGTDQDVHVRLARDIASRYKNYYFMQLSSTYNMFLPGLKGGKMSSSDPMSHIALSDDIKEAANKVKKYAFSGGQSTVEEHKKKGGNPDVDVSFQMLKFGLEEDDEKLAQIHHEYRTGKMLTGELKQYTVEKLTKFLEQHQKKREKALKVAEKYVEGLF